jgi:Cu/Ag efflux protein CusF
MCCVVLSLGACSRAPQSAPAKQYSLTGKIVSIDTKEHTAAVDAGPIPGFMDAMKMDYPITSAADLAALKVGENISATLNVGTDGSYSLSNIHERK